MNFPLEKIEPRFVERVWGSYHLEPWFAAQQKKIGEVWFDAGPLLIKFLFTTEALSVQVHPDDAYAAEHHGRAGKTEMWRVLRAERGARIAAGFREPVSLETARRSALDGSIESLLGWHEASAGDTFLIPARTVHALGAGLVVCEVQQTSDITYRLYDYGRGRELHLDHGLAVADLGPHPGKVAVAGGAPVECDYFRVDCLRLSQDWECDRNCVVAVLEGEGAIADRGFRLGEVWRVPRGTRIEARGEGSVLRIHAPEY